MTSWPFAVFLLVVWCLWAGAAAAHRAAEDARRGIPEGQRGGVSILPAIPVFPVVSWSIAWLMDRAVSPWGTWAVGVSHGVFAACLFISLVRDRRRIRLVKGGAGRGRFR